MPEGEDLFGSGGGVGWARASVTLAVRGYRFDGCALGCTSNRPSEFERIMVDSTVQEKAIAYPVDSRRLEIARDKMVVHAKRGGIALRQSFAKEGKTLKRKAGGYAHAKQFKRLHRTVKQQRTMALVH